MAGSACHATLRSTPQLAPAPVPETRCPECGALGEHRHPDAPSGSRRRQCACGYVFVVCAGCGNAASQHDDGCDLCGQPLQ